MKQSKTFLECFFCLKVGVHSDYHRRGGIAVEIGEWQSQKEHARKEILEQEIHEKNAILSENLSLVKCELSSMTKFYGTENAEQPA